MRKGIFIILITLILVCFALSKTHPVLENSEVASSIKLLESWIEAQMDYRKIPGISLGIVLDQELIYTRGFGYSDLDKKTPVTHKTIYRIASITKTFTVTAIMQLRDQGKLHLDDPIERYLPWFRIKNRFPDAPEITIRHLLTHTSGLPREAAFPYWTDHKFPTREEIIKALPAQETIFPTETKIKYSNLGLALAGEIVSTVSGEAYGLYIQNHILDPLGMKDTSVYLTEEDKSKLTTPYSRLLPDGSHKVMPFTDSKGIAPAANMSSNVGDLALYISLQFREGSAGGNQILKGSTLREMHRVHWLQPDWSGGRGLGFSVWRQDEKTVIGHSGWVAGNRTQIVFIPEEKIGIIVLTNSDDGDPDFFVRQTFKLMMPVIKKAVTSRVAIAKADPAWNKYVGLYTDTSWFDTEILILNNKLVMKGYRYPPYESPSSGIIELTPEGKHTFKMTGENGNGELVVFGLDSNDNVVKVKVGENYIYPKE